MADTLDIDPEKFLTGMFSHALKAVHPDTVMDMDLPDPPAGRTIVIGAGKAAASMAAALERRCKGPVEGLVVTRYDHACRTESIEVVEASHPVPDQRGLEATQRIMELAQSAGRDDFVIVLMSGGASALLTAPAPGITLEQKQAINRALLKSGARISEMNCVRRYLSAVKGGRLAAMIEPARSLTLVISDVAGDDPAVVGSGPTVAPSTTPSEALAILERFGIEAPPEVMKTIRDSSDLSALDPRRHQVKVVANARMMLSSAAQFARQAGVGAVILGDDLEIEAESLARVHASLIRQIRWGGGIAGAPCVLISGGESSVAVHGTGSGGRNGQFLLALALSLQGEKRCWAIACDSDGIDGTQPSAGGIITPSSVHMARESGMVPESLLGNNDSHGFLAGIDALVTTGPTLTNVNDFRAVLLLD